MPKKLSRLLQEYKSPEFLINKPGFIRIQHILAWLMTLRFWHLRKAVFRILKEEKEDFVLLDVGCGSGEILFPVIRSFPMGHFVGADVNRSALRTFDALKKHLKMTRVDIYQLDIEREQPPVQADLVMCNSVLQILQNPGIALENLKSSLTPKGKLLLYIPVNYHRILPGYRYIRQRWAPEVMGEAHNRTNFSYFEEILPLIEEQDMEILEKYYVYGLAGKIAFELMSIGILGTLKFPWLLAFLFALIYFPVVAVPAWILMGIDLRSKPSVGNGLILVLSNKNARTNGD